jgi:hypothetical protein
MHWVCSVQNASFVIIINNKFRLLSRQIPLGPEIIPQLLSFKLETTVLLFFKRVLFKMHLKCCAGIKSRFLPRLSVIITLQTEPLS